MASPLSIVDLTVLLEKDDNNVELFEQELYKLKESFDARGWSFVRITENLLEQGAETVDAASIFFDEVSCKEQFKFPPGYGYCETADKRMFRLLTGTFCDGISLPSQSSFSSHVRGLSALLDSVCFELVKSIAPTVFGASAEEIGVDQNIPLLRFSGGKAKKAAERGKKTLNSLTNRVGMKMYAPEDSFPPDILIPYGMLDIVEYVNRDSGKGVKAGEGKYNVAAHGDPGLLAFSLLSTEPGLKLLDPELDTWFGQEDLPKNEDKIGVFWCGNAATEVTEGRIPAGIHQVLTSSRPRKTIWYEICVAAQVPHSIRRHGFHNKHNFNEDPSSMQQAEAMTISCKTLTGKSVNLYPVFPHDKVMKLFTLIQDLEGIPPDKNRMIFAGKILEKERLIQDYNFRDGSTIHCVLRLRAGQEEAKVW
eukprot:CAMPEP_0204829406 /NCGR_PEP_ID=MMETSP1346-20131115/7547_1 /ASSEMBLY_ACC=CAM_ASM_000771 /TAXON_ID=215587 /ORGANISM="Aplanochytrium stocchinoi, Strain GSBS06" /LENGTH=420 /DNA_ID=CAMNT_0051959163 /DNA_START=76 /DNA_END=1335 /DNA_ORIENTATION=-